MRRLTLAPQRPLKVPTKSPRASADSTALRNEARSPDQADFFTMGYEGRTIKDLFGTLNNVVPTRTRVPILVALGAVLGASITWALLGGSSNASSERRALEQRAAELAARTLAPGSPLACLHALAGESVEAACGKAIFASPASVAAATSYVAARLALLSDMTAYAGRNSAAIDAARPLRR